MSPGVDAANRIALTLLGLVLTVAGGLGLALSFGAFGDARTGQPVLSQGTTDFVQRNDWFWWAMAGGCLLVGLLALWWLSAQTRTERVGQLDLTEDDAEGTTVVHAGALTSAVEQEVATFLGVGKASAGLRGKSSPRLDLTVDLDDTADFGDISRRLQEETVPRTRQALGTPDLPFRIELRPAAGTTRTGAPRITREYRPTATHNSRTRPMSTRSSLHSGVRDNTAETKPSFKTTEIIVYLLAVAGVLIASAMVDENADGQGFGAERAWLYVTILTIGYMVGRGLAKAGSHAKEDD